MAQITEVVDIQSPDDVALADKMKAGRDQILTELRKTIVGQEDTINQVLLSLIGFAALYALLFSLFIFLLNRHIQEGPPDMSEEVPPESLPDTLREIFSRKPRASAAGESDVAG